MLPSRPTLRSWNPESLATSADAIDAGALSVSGAVTDIEAKCQSMPAAEAWSGHSHDAALEMFRRASNDASEFSKYANAIASALRGGSAGIGAARTALLTTADQVDQGPLNVSDQWVVLIDPIRMSAEQLANLEQLAKAEQATINGMLTTVGQTDEAAANAVLAAGRKFGFVDPGPMTSDPGSLMLPPAQRPGDQVPNPNTSVGMLEQEALRDGEMSITIRETTSSVNKDGEQVMTAIMQDGSKSVITKHSPFDWQDRGNFITIDQFDKNGNKTSEASSWHDYGNSCDYTSISWPDNSNFTMTVDSTGVRNAGFTTALGRHAQIPVEMIDNISLVSGAGLSGLEKHLVNGGALPMITASSIEDLGKAAKFGGPALGVATTIFDMAMADTGKDACIAAVAGAGGMGGGWGGAELGAFLGAYTGPAAPLAVPGLAFVFGLAGGSGLADVGKFVGDVVCPY
jgi:hypothetical protein